MTTENNKKESEVKDPPIQFGISAEADFEKNLWSFQMPDKFEVWAGEFAIVDKKAWVEILKNFAATPPSIEGEIKSKEEIINKFFPSPKEDSYFKRVYESRVIEMMEAYASQFTASKEKEYREALEKAKDYYEVAGYQSHPVQKIICEALNK